MWNEIQKNKIVKQLTIQHIFSQTSINNPNKIIPAIQIKIMSKNTIDEKQKVNTKKQEKPPFYSMGADNSPKQSTFKSMLHPIDTYQNSPAPRHYKFKDAQDQALKNKYAEDTSSTVPYTTNQNYLSRQNLGASVLMNNLSKNVRQSENIHVSDTRTPPNSLNDKRIIVTKSASNLTKPNQEFLYIKSGNNQKQTSKQLDTEQNKQLVDKIKHIQMMNEKIREQNIQLRLKKLSSNAEPMQVLNLKLQIQQIKRKIQKLKVQASKIDNNYSQYYKNQNRRDSQSSNQVNKDSNQNMKLFRGKATEFLPRTLSNIQCSAAYIATNPYQIPQPIPEHLTKSRQHENLKANRVKKYSVHLLQNQVQDSKAKGKYSQLIQHQAAQSSQANQESRAYNKK